MINDRKAIEAQMHVRGHGTRHGGTLVWAAHQQGDSFLFLATAVCSKDDQYSKKIANGVMDINILDGHWIKLPLPTDWNRHAVTKDMLVGYIEKFGDYMILD